jgi:Cys-tRNA synthase (O-phospho-L-seryl-tRNA:Cys-tRNA synthase)
MWRSTIAPSYLDTNLTLSLLRFYYHKFRPSLICACYSRSLVTVTYSYEMSQINVTRKESHVHICRYLYCEISHLEVNDANERQIAHVLVKMVARLL